MKKAKFMLAAIAVLAIAGGVYASKTAKQSLFIYTTAPNGPAGACTVKVNGFTLQPNAGTPVVKSASTTFTLECDLTTIYPTI